MSKNQLIATVVFITLLQAKVLHAQEEQVPQHAEFTLSGSELLEAVRLAETLFPVEYFDYELADYRLIKAENLFLATSGQFRGARCWRLTYKHRELIPDTPDGIVGAGGVIFIGVNLDTRTALVTGYGE